MEKSFRIKINRAINFKNHIQLCRLCLCKFSANVKKIKITTAIENQYFMLTQFDLDASPKYSNKICEKCFHFLNEFTILKNDWIYKQSELEKYVENPTIYISDDDEEEDVKPENIKIEPEMETEVGNDFDYHPVDSDNEIMIKKELKIEDEPKTAKKNSDYLDDPEFKPKRKSYPKKPKVERTFKCTHCPMAFHRAITLDNHQVYRHPETLTQEEIKAIKERDRANRIRICPECGITTDTLKQHILYVHEQLKKFFCDYCDYKTHKKFNMRSHVLRHINLEKKYTCHICGRKFTRKQGFNSHMRDFHENTGRVFKCHCGKEYNTNGKLWKHKKWKHMEDSKVPCPHCNKDIMKDGLAEHMRVDPEDKFNVYACNECGKVFPNKRCLNHHRTLHQERNFFCDFPDCSKAFASLVNLQSHQKWHTNRKIYDCPYEGCDKSYTKHQGLRTHIAIKHEHYRKKCPIGDCPYESGIFQDMRGHVRRHKEIKPEVLDEYIIAIRKLNLL